MRSSSQPSLEAMQANLIQLLNLYSTHPCKMTANAISLTLEGMLEHPLIDIFPELRKQCASTLNHWRLRASPGSIASDMPVASLH
jgi:hypothetical protein